MAEFTKTTTYTVTCPNCEADYVIRVGVRNGQQRYRCKRCKKDFRANDKAKGRRMDSEMVGSELMEIQGERGVCSTCSGSFPVSTC